ncbi:hypothetical protein BLNAU_23931 [Blattamonas nauphoetae]|uniref:Uncharacterized protein n=1 Tax=Blattamonas nauphoetae TaxID=2049346 RepID=A0ABQ9WNU7_9EUKA|nr:hypothetical protein BLNAU_23931 [Blattamonas nauphoetae]
MFRLPHCHSAPLTAQCALPPISSLGPQNCEWSLGFVDPLITSMRSEPIENMDASSCCCLSSGVAVVYVEPADLCAPSSLAISGLSTLSLAGNGISELPLNFFLSLPNLRRVELSLSELTPTIDRKMLTSHANRTGTGVFFFVSVLFV